MGYGHWAPYVPVAVRRAKALVKMEKLRERGLDVQPINVKGRIISKTFWGKAWSDHLESLGDFENRLPRGRTYVRNGSVCHLAISKGKVEAKVIGSKLYNVKISIKTLVPNKWKELKNKCTGQVGSLLELLQGRLSEEVLEVVTDKENGLFPLSDQIKLSCSCPDWATMCKHVAATLYGVGARLDDKPELLFLLRGVRQEELIDTSFGVTAATEGTRAGRRRIANDDLSEVFSINLGGEDIVLASEKPAKRTKPSGKKQSAKSPKVSKPKPKKTPSVRKARAITPISVARLRSRFGMSQAAFAILMNVSTGTIGNWENKSSPIKLKPDSQEAWHAIKGLTKQQARKRLAGSA